MAKIVTTQYRENYGAHDWDGTGECPQYWKNKGGSTYVILGEGANHESVVNYVINHSSDYSEEYVMHVEERADYNSVFEPWEDRRYIYINSSLSHYPIMEVLKSSDEDLRRGLKSYRKTWEYENAKDRHSGECKKFNVQYVFEDDYVANSEEEALAHFETILS